MAGAVLTLLLGSLWGATGASAQPGGDGAQVYGLTDAGELVAFDPANPSQVYSTVALSGDAASDELLGIDFRPATGELYSIGASSTVYTIDPVSGEASAIGETAPALEGSVIGFDFNPTADAIRVVTDSGQNLRLTDLDSALGTTVDGTLAYDEGDPGAGSQPSVVGAGYTNNVPDATETMLYDLDLASGNLLQQDANPGVLTTIGSLGVPLTASSGFDISPDGAAYATLQPGEGQPSSLYSIDLETGAAQEIGAIGSGLVLSGFAIPTGETMQTIPDTGGISLLALGGAALILSGGTLVALRARGRTSREV